MTQIGEINRLVGVVIDLFPIGPRALIVGQGILGLVGEATRGPCNKAVWVGNYNGSRRIFHSGDLKEACELGFNNGVPAICAIGVKGQGNLKSSVTLTDGLANPSNVGAFYAKYEGIYGNSLSTKISRSTHKINLVFNNMPGDGTVGPYWLEQHGLLNYGSNWIKVNGIAREIVYSQAELAASKVFLDIIAGSMLFADGENIETSDQMSGSVKYNALRVQVTDNVQLETFDGIVDLVDLQAKLTGSQLIDFVPEPYETHFPGVGSGIAVHPLTGGSDGAPITVDDWNTAMDALASEVNLRAGGATCYALTSCEVEFGTRDLIPEFDGFLVRQENAFKPGMGYVGLQPNTSKDVALDIASNFNSRNLYIVVNPWDDPNSSVRQNGAVALAARRAAAPLGESCAKAEYALKGMNGLLNEFEDDDVDVIDEGRLNVLIKKVGILPYLDRSTASDQQFWRAVDNYTINWCEIACKYICDGYKHWKATPQTCEAIRESLAAVMDDLRSRKIVRVYTLTVYRDLDIGGVDTGKIWIDLNAEPIGHAERFRVNFGVGVMPYIKE